MLGKTAYAKGQKLYGTLIAQAEEGYPTYGTDTSNATATEADIAYGKTAYARGQLLIGTAQNMSPDVEEIYGLSSENYDIDTVSNCINPPDGESPVYSIDNITYSQNGDYCVRMVSVLDNESCVESFAINNQGPYYQASSGTTDTDITYKKYRYSFDELGIVLKNGGEFNGIYGIALGAPGFKKKSNECILAIIYNERKLDEADHILWEKQYLRLLTYHLSENGVIGKAYKNENIIDETIEITNLNNTNAVYEQLIPDRNNPLIFYALYKNALTFETEIRLDKLVLRQSTNLSYTVNIFEGNNKVTCLTNTYGFRGFITSDNKYCYILSGFDNGYTPYSFISNISQNNTPGDLQRIQDSEFGSFHAIESINNKLYGISYDYGSGSGKYNPIIYIREISEQYGKFTVSENKKIIKLSNFANSSLLIDATPVTNFIITADKKRIIINLCSTATKKNSIIAVYDFEQMISVNDGETINIDALQTWEANNLQNFSVKNFSANQNGSRIFFNYRFFTNGYTELLALCTNSEDTENIIGVKYKGKTFYSLQGGQLTAGGPDVRKGKTYIGWMGYPETGIAEF